MITPKEVKSQAEAILALCKKVNGLAGKFGSDEHRKADDAFWDAVNSLDTRATAGLGDKENRCVPGRLLRFGIGDGFAYYIIEKVLKHSVKVIHLPYGEALTSPGVDNRDGEADLMTAEDMIKWTDELARAAKGRERVETEEVE